MAHEPWPVQPVDALGNAISGAGKAAASRGELAGSITAAVMPTVTGTQAIVKARANNTGNVYIGGSGVTRPDGTTDTTTGYELAPGDVKTYALVANFNELYRICDNVGDALTYEVWS